MKHLMFFKQNSWKKMVDFNYLKLFLKTNIRMTWGYPKTIFYSERLNSGEKFMLRNYNLFPYYYSYDNQNLTASYSLESSLNEEILSKTTNNDGNMLHEKLLNDYYYLVNQIKSDNELDLDMPFAVLANIINAYNMSCTGQIPVNLELEDHQIEVILNIIDLKLEFADSASLVKILGFLHQRNIRNELSDRILGELLNKQFEPEFTMISNRSPFLFRYEEISNKENKLTQQDFINEGKTY